MNTKKKSQEVSPRQFVESRGLAKIEVIAAKEKILKWIDEGYSYKSIYQALSMNRIISKYCYRTFTNAIKAVFVNTKEIKQHDNGNVINKEQEKLSNINDESKPKPKHFKMDFEADLINKPKDK